MPKKIKIPVTSKSTEIIRNKKLDSNFKPSMKTLTRILNYVEDKGPAPKTKLSQKTNLNYTRLAKHIVWLEKKGYVESIIQDSQINVKLTNEGKVFAESISN